MITVNRPGFETSPSKAKALFRFLPGVFAWQMNSDFCLHDCKKTEY